MNTDLVVIESQDVVQLPSADSARQQLKRVEDFKRVVRELFVVGHDYGVIPGTGDKPTLLKPGAEKLIKLLGLADQYDFLEKAEEWERGFFNYTVRCRLVSMNTGQIVAEGLGNCNSWESKYRYRWAWSNELSDAEKIGLKQRKTRNGSVQYRLENEDIASSVNTILKMAKKRAQMDAALSAGRLSDVFTQDLEDITANRQAASGELEPEPPSKTPTGEAALKAGVLDNDYVDVRKPASSAKATEQQIATWQIGITTATSLGLDATKFGLTGNPTKDEVGDRISELRDACAEARAKMAQEVEPALGARVGAAE